MEEQEGGVRVNTHEGKRPEKHVTPIRTTTVINYTTTKQLQRQNVTRVTPDLCSINTGTGCLSPHNDTLQLHDGYGGGNDDDDESDDGEGSSDHDVLQHVKELGVVQVELCGHQIVHSSVGDRLDRLLHLQLQTIFNISKTVYTMT